MQNNEIRFFGLFILLLTITACSQKQNDTSHPVTFNRIEMNDTTRLIPQNDSPYCRFTIDMEQASRPDSVARLINYAIVKQAFSQENMMLKAAIDSFKTYKSALYKSQLANLYESDKANNITSEWYDYAYSFKGQHSIGYHHCICYQIDVKRYEGGVDAVCETFYMNFNPETGKQLTLADVFTPENSSVLQQKLIESLEEKFKCDSIGLHEKGILKHTPLFVTENFKLGTDSITFLYNTYEIAPYNIGAISLQIPYHRIKELMLKSDK